MAVQPADAATIEAEVDHVRSLGIDALRRRWRIMFGAIPPPGLTKDIIARMIAYRIQEDAFGGLDAKTARLLDRMARGEKPSELNRRLKPGTVLIREYNGERHTVTVVTDGFVWQGATYTGVRSTPRNQPTINSIWNSIRSMPNGRPARPISRVRPMRAGGRPPLL